MLEQMAENLHIRQGKHEAKNRWEWRVIYSVIGLSMLASAYDYDGEAIEAEAGVTVSMQHVLNRGEDLAGLLSVYDQGIVCDIRKAYIENGYMLHRANRLTYPYASFSKLEDVFYTRGQLPWRVDNMSGLGTFTKRIIAGIKIDPDIMFHIDKHHISDWFTEFQKRVHWRHIDRLPENVEYTNVHGERGAPYWIAYPPKDGITIYRDRNPVNRQYKLIDISSHAVYSLPDWRTSQKEYLRIFLALRLTAGQKHVVYIRNDGIIAEVDPSYLLPPREQNLYELFSWPNTEASGWKRIISAEVLPLIKEIFEKMGFVVEEGQ